MTPDLDALAALLAAATSHPPWIRRWESMQVHWMGGDDAMNSQQDVDLAVAAVNALPSLIEAARREAGLREALAELLAARDADMGEDNSAQMLEWASREYRACEAARSLLHDSAVAATGDEVGEP